MTKFFHIILFLIGTTRVSAQLPTYHAQLFGAEQGIGNGTIQDQSVDNQGFLWITFIRALQRFDGRTVKSFNFDEVLQNTICDQRNRIWTCTEIRVYRIHPQSNQVEKLPFDTSEGRRPRALFQLPGHPLRLLSNQGVWEWQEKEHRFFPLNWKISASRLTPYRFDTCGTTLFFQHGTDVCAFDVRRQRLVTLPGEDVFSIYALTPDLAVINDFRGRSFWYNFAHKTIQSLDKKRYLSDESPGHLRIYGVVTLGGAQFLMSSFTGLLRYDLQKDAFTRERVFNEGKPLDYENSLQRLYQEKPGKYWAHVQTGLVMIDDLRHTLGLLRNYHTEGPQMWQNRAINFVEDEAENIWFGTGHGFTRLSQRDGTTRSWLPVEGATDRLAFGSIRGLSLDGNKVILAPTNFGLWIFDSRTQKYQRPLYVSDSVQQSSERDFFDGLYWVKNKMWLALGRDQLYCLAKKENKYQLSFAPLPIPQINTNVALQDHKGRIWVGGMRGVYALDSTAQKVLWNIVLNNPVLGMMEEAPNQLLIGTASCLLRLHVKGQQYHFDTIPLPFTAHDISLIFRDKRKRIWIGCDNGLVLCDSKFKNFRRFDYADNVQSIVFSSNATLLARNGLVFLGGPNGINYFYPENFELFDHPLKVSLASLDINNRDSTIYDFQHPLRLKHWQNMLTLEVLAPYYNNAGKIQYRYRIPGVFPDWINNGNESRIRLSGLPPGKYEIEVAASILGRQWFKSAQTAVISILPPWWGTLYFRILAMLGLAGMVFGMVWRREKQLRQKQRQQLEMVELRNTSLQYQLESAEHKVALSTAEEERQKALLNAVDNQRKAAEAKLQSMRLQMNPHFLFNALNSIQQMVMVGQEREAAQYLAKFSKLLRQVLTHSDRETVVLKEEIAMLHLFVELESLRFDATFRYQINCDTEIDAEEYYIPTLLIQPFVENAIWHGLLHREGQRRLEIWFCLNEQEQLCCHIKDNGIGRAAARQHSEGRPDGSTGKGMSISQERIKILNQQTGKNHQLFIHDLYDEQAQANGTEVVLVFDV